MPSTVHQFYAMASDCAVHLWGETAEHLELFAAGAEAEVRRIETRYSRYRDDSELSLINRTADGRAVTVSDPMLSVLRAATEVSARSGGAFDVTVGPLVRLWGFHEKKPHVPTPAELEKVRPLVSYENLVIDEASHTVRFRRSGVEIDLGGIAKGFAVELAANVLRNHGLSGFVDAGGNQYMLGLPPGKAYWTVGIKDPDFPEKLLGVLEVGEGSLSTSAQYANFLTTGTRRYGHILDPRTLQPSESALSVTIISRDGTLADALSKVGFILGPEKGLKVIESFPGTTAIIAYRKPDGSVGLAQSPGLAGRFHPVPSPAASPGHP